MSDNFGVLPPPQQKPEETKKSHTLRNIAVIAGVAIIIFLLLSLCSSSIFIVPNLFGTQDTATTNLIGVPGKIDVYTDDASQTIISTPQSTSTTSSPTYNNITLTGLDSAGPVLSDANGSLYVGLINLESQIEGILSVANGGTGLSTAPSLGQILIGNSDGTYGLKNIVAGSNILIENTANSIIISSTASGGGGGGGGGTGTVTEITAGIGLSGGTITTTGTIAVDSPTCAAGEVLTWNAGFVCVVDQSTPPGAGITELNGLTDGTQAFAVGTSGTDFNIASSAGVHTFNIPSASAANRGLVTIGVQTFGGNKTFSNNLAVGGTLGVTGATTLGNTLGVTGATTLSNTLGVTGATTLSNTLSVSGDATFVSAIIANGNTTLGNASSDTVTFNAGVNSNINPFADNTYDLGSLSQRWRDLYLGPSSLNISSTTGTSGTGANYTLFENGFTGGTARLVTSNFGTNTTGNFGGLSLITGINTGQGTNAGIDFSATNNLGASDRLLNLGDSGLASIFSITGNGITNLTSDTISTASNVFSVNTTSNHTTGQTNLINSIGTFSPASGNGVFRGMLLQLTSNTAGGVTGAVTGGSANITHTGGLSALAGLFATVTLNSGSAVTSEVRGLGTFITQNSGANDSLIYGVRNTMNQAAGATATDFAGVSNFVSVGGEASTIFGMRNTINVLDTATNTGTVFGTYNVLTIDADTSANQYGIQTFWGNIENTGDAVDLNVLKGGILNTATVDVGIFGVNVGSENQGTTEAMVGGHFGVLNGIGGVINNSLTGVQTTVTNLGTVDDVIGNMISVTQDGTAENFFGQYIGNGLGGTFSNAYYAAYYQAADLGAVNNFGLFVEGASGGSGINASIWVDSGLTRLAPATTADASLRLASSVGTDVAAPESGDLWWNGTELFFYDGSGNVDLLAGGGGGDDCGSDECFVNGGNAFGELGVLGTTDDFGLEIISGLQAGAGSNPAFALIAADDLGDSDNLFEVSDDGGATTFMALSGAGTLALTPNASTGATSFLSITGSADSGTGFTNGGLVSLTAADGRVGGMRGFRSELTNNSDDLTGSISTFSALLTNNATVGGAANVFGYFQDQTNNGTINNIWTGSQTNMYNSASGTAGQMDLFRGGITNDGILLGAVTAGTHMSVDNNGDAQGLALHEGRVYNFAPGTAGYMHILHGQLINYGTADSAQSISIDVSNQGTIEGATGWLGGIGGAVQNSGDVEDVMYGINMGISSSGPVGGGLIGFNNTIAASDSVGEYVSSGYSIIGLGTSISISASTVSNDVYGVRSVISGDSTVPNVYGAYINATNTGSTNNYGLYINEVSGASGINASLWVESGLSRFAPATTGTASINIASSAATDPASPNSGDLWWNGTELNFYNGTSSIDLLAAGGGGSVTEVATGNGLTGGPITSSGTIQIDAPTCIAGEALTWTGTAFDCIEVGGGGSPVYTAWDVFAPPTDENDLGYVVQSESDEFEDPTVDPSWLTYDHSSVIDSVYANNGELAIKLDIDSSDFAGVYKDLPATGEWTVETHVKMFSESSIYRSVGLGLFTDAGANNDWWHIRLTREHDGAIRTDKWLANNAYIQDYSTFLKTWSAETAFLRWTFDGTNYRAFWSMDGIQWAQTASLTVADLSGAPTEFGLVTNYASDGDFPLWGLFDFVRVYDTALDEDTPAQGQSIGYGGGGGGGGGGTPAAPSGSVQFNDGGSFGGNSLFVWDDTDEFLGIGTSGPATKLDISANLGGLNSIGLRLGGTDSNGAMIALDQTGIGSWGFGMQSGSSDMSIMSGRTLADAGLTTAIFGYDTGATYTAPNNSAYFNVAGASEDLASLNLASSGGLDPVAPVSGDLWWNGTELNFYNGTSNIDLLATGGGGTVSEVATGNGLSGGPITSSGTIQIDSPTCIAGEALTWTGTAFDCIEMEGGGGGSPVYSTWDVFAPPTDDNDIGYVVEAESDEFEGASIDPSWTAYDPGTVVASAAESGGKLVIELTTDSGGWGGFYKPLPATSEWTIETHVSMQSEAFGNRSVGLSLFEDAGSDGSQRNIRLTREQDGAFRADTWSNYNTWGGDFGYVSKNWSAEEAFLRWTYDGEDYRGYWSYDGIAWDLFATVNNDFMAPVEYGPVAMYNADGDHPLWANFNFIRVYDTALDADVPAQGQEIGHGNTGSGGGSAAGSDGEIQFNDGGSFGSNGLFVWDNANSRLGIGTATPNADLEINNNFLDTNGIGLLIADSGTNNGAFMNFAQYGWSWGLGMNPGSDMLSIRSGMWTGGAGGEVLSINTNGNVSIGSFDLGSRLNVGADLSGEYAAELVNSGNNTDRMGLSIQAGEDTPSGSSTLIAFADGDGDEVGTITFDGTGTHYNTTSDLRLKENIGSTALNLDTLMNINIVDYNFIGSDITTHGVIAQDLFEIYPDAVAVPSDDSKYWQVDYSRLTPLIIKSIQDQKGLIDGLTARITELENQLAVYSPSEYVNNVLTIQTIIAENAQIQNATIQKLTLGAQSSGNFTVTNGTNQVDIEIAGFNPAAKVFLTPLGDLPTGVNYKVVKNQNGFSLVLSDIVTTDISFDFILVN